MTPKQERLFRVIRESLLQPAVVTGLLRTFDYEYLTDVTCGTVTDALRRALKAYAEDASRILAVEIEKLQSEEHAVAHDATAQRLSDAGVRVDEDGCCTTCGRDVFGCHACNEERDAAVRALYVQFEALVAAIVRDDGKGQMVAIRAGRAAITAVRKHYPEGGQ